MEDKKELIECAVDKDALRGGKGNVVKFNKTVKELSSESLEVLNMIKDTVDKQNEEEKIEFDGILIRNKF